MIINLTELLPCLKMMCAWAHCGWGWWWLDFRQMSRAIKNTACIFFSVAKYLWNGNVHIIFKSDKLNSSKYLKVAPQNPKTQQHCSCCECSLKLVFAVLCLVSNCSSSHSSSDNTYPARICTVSYFTVLVRHIPIHLNGILCTLAKYYYAFCYLLSHAFSVWVYFSLLR